MILKATRRRIVLCLAFVVALAGCKEVLYSNLTEADANDMVSILEASGINTARERDKDSVYEIWVDGNSVAAANVILRAQGFPRRSFVSMDEIFSAEGLVGSPFEERVRYVFGLEEKLTEALISIDGIRDARVTINIPEAPQFRDAPPKSTASVILHYEENFSAQEAVPKIKTMLASSVAGLVYDNVSIVIFPVGGTTVEISPQAGLISAANASPLGVDRAQIILQSMGSQSLIGLLISIIVLSMISMFLVSRTLRWFGVRWGN